MYDFLDGSIGELYPVIPTETVTFPVKKVQSKAILDLRMLEDSRRKMGYPSYEKSDLWQLQLAVFEARMEALKEMIRRGYHPVDDARVYIHVTVEQRAVSDEADVDRIPEDMHYVMAYQSGGIYG